jgi:hypothetical protein
MERLDDLSEDDYRDSPDVPTWFNDNQPSNFGKSSNGQVKIRDYAMTNIGAVLGLAPPHRAAWQGPKK